jgi:outer membrane protein assembly factor BamB
MVCIEHKLMRMKNMWLWVSVLAVFGNIEVARADDWPAWRGADRTGVSKETGWNQKWPAGGLKKLWEAPGGVGLSSFAVSQGKVYTMGNVGEKDTVFCYDAESGNLVWKYEYACASKDPNDFNGSRCTPTVDGNRVYTLSRQGHFYCLDAEKGTVVWSKDFKKDFKGEEPKWGFAGSPWIEKDWVLTETGGAGASVVAFNKVTGELVWKSGKDEAGYSSIIAYDFGGERCFIQFAADKAVARRMKDGAEIWRVGWKTEYGVNAATPIIQGDEVFISSGYGFGGAVLKLDKGKQVWKNKVLRNQHTPSVLYNGFLYGFDDGDKALKCVDWKSGKEKWSTKAYGQGSLVVVDGKLLLYGQKGKLGLAEASPNGFKEICSFQPLPEANNTWASPVLSNGRIFVRSKDKVAAFDAR